MRLTSHEYRKRHEGEKETGIDVNMSRVYIKVEYHFYT